MTLDFLIITDNWPLFVEGAWVTIQLCVIASLVGGIFAWIVTAMSLSGIAPLRWLSAIYLAVFRGIPFIVIVFLVHFGMPSLGFRLPAFMSGALALSLFAAAYYAEVLRAGLGAVSQGQWQSAKAVGMSRLQALRYIILPQIVRPSLPPTVNTTITMIKESSVISAITVSELTYQGLVVQGNTFAPFEVFVAIALIYWLLTACVARLGQWAEIRLGARQHSTAHRNKIAAQYLSLGKSSRI